MRTRCPTCATIFRVTSAQLRAKAGTVRCGQCHALFNAFDSLLPDNLDTSLSEATAPASVVEPAAPPPPNPIPPAPEEEIVVDLPPIVGENAAFSAIEQDPEEIDDWADTSEEVVADAPAEDKQEEAQAESAPLEEPPIEEASPLAEPLEESVEESTEAARAAGLIAARELSETQAYNRWAVGALTTPSISGFEPTQAKAARWPYVLATFLLLLVLLGQLLHHYRTEAALRLPFVGDFFAALDIPVPLPGHVDLVSIEASDLQSDNARGLLVLQATLKNRAGYAQAWPALELTLTDTQDAVVARRVMGANDYLPPDADHDRFAANGETGVRLWIETRDLRASGYRVYIFYP